MKGVLIVMKKILVCLLGLIIILTLTGMGSVHREDTLQPEIAKKILRFHVLANSDSDEDQSVKLKVRDGVGCYVEELLADSKSRKQTEEILNENIDQIIAVANDILKQNGMEYEAGASIVSTDFPVKQYGEYTFPEGRYRALQIRLGKAKGHNWWCVLYPNLCFRGTMYENVDEESDELLREVLSPDEYKDVVDSGNFVLKLKILEYLPFTS